MRFPAFEIGLGRVGTRLRNRPVAIAPPRPRALLAEVSLEMTDKGEASYHSPLWRRGRWCRYGSGNCVDCGAYTSTVSYTLGIWATHSLLYDGLSEGEEYIRPL